MISRTLNSLSFLVAVILLASCVQLSYENAMPQSSRVMPSFPAEMQGKYISISDPESYIKVEEGSISMPDFFKALGDEFELRPYQKYFVANFKEEYGWIVYLAEWSDSNTIVIYTIDVEDEASLLDLEDITQAEKFYDENGELERVHIAPTDKEFKKMLDQNLFTELDRFKK